MTKPQSYAPRLRRRSLSARLVLVMGGLVAGTALVLSALAIYLLGVELERSAQTQLETAQASADALLAQHVSEAARLARWLNADPAAHNPERAELHTLAARLQDAWPSALLRVDDDRGQPLFTTFPPELTARSASSAPDAHGLSASSDCRLFALARAGTLAVALPLDEQFVQQLQQQTRASAWLLCGTREAATVLGAHALEIDPQLADTVLVRGQNYLGSSRIDGVLSYGRYVPLRDRQGRVIGMLGLAQPQQTLSAPRENATRLFGALALLFAALVIAEAYLLARRITRPLSTLSDAARALGAGDLHTPLHVRGDDELARLAQSFEAMRLQLAQSYAALAQEKDRYRDFLAVMPHEFKTPLAALAASLELLESDAQTLSADQRALVGSIQRAVIRLQSLVDNLLDTVSVQAGQLQVQPEPHELASLIEQARAFTQPLLDQKRQPLRVCLPPDLPRVLADPRRITQVLINLISNAHKYGPPDAPLDVQAAREGAFVRVAVRDGGAGIPLAQQQGLFQRFARANGNGTSAHAGLGFGLALTREIVEMHHGAVGLHSADGAGTTVWFTLPQAAESRA